MRAMIVIRGSERESEGYMNFMLVLVIAQKKSKDCVMIELSERGCFIKLNFFSGSFEKLQTSNGKNIFANF